MNINPPIKLRAQKGHIRKEITVDVAFETYQRNVLIQTAFSRLKQMCLLQYLAKYQHWSAN